MLKATRGLVVITTQLTLLEYVLNGYRKVAGDA